MVSPERHIAAMEKINALLNVRERTVKETRERLGKHGFNEEEIDEAIQSALRVGMLDEHRYTRSFIRGKTHSGWGRIKIIQRLRQNGVDDSIIEACREEFPDPDLEYESALRELSKRSSYSSNPYASYMRRLMSKGYSFEVSARAVKEFMATQT